MKDLRIIALFLLLPVLISCKKRIDLPVIETHYPEFLGTENALLGGNVLSSDGDDITEYGIYIGTKQSPEITGQKIPINHSGDTFRVRIEGLASTTNYFVKAYAIKEGWVSLGEQINFTTTAKVTDIDNNVYSTVKVGFQLWFVENLRATKLNDGTSIPQVTDVASWQWRDTPAYCWYNNDMTEYEEYGVYYNWYTVKTGKICPNGWRVPNNNDWAIFEEILGRAEIAGSKIKEGGLDHWRSPNTATNESGFTGLGGGYRNYNGDFLGLGDVALWASANEKDERDAWNWAVWPNNLFEQEYYWKSAGLNVRCVKD